MEPLKVVNVEYYPKENAKNHHTNEYDLVHDPDTPTPILRRGNDFLFAVKFNRAYDITQDAIRIGFNMGPKSTFVKGTRVLLLLAPKVKSFADDGQHWGVLLNSHDEDTLIFKIRIPYNVPVGIWHCSIQTNIKGIREIKEEYKGEDDIYIIFNPWCKNDGVYMETKDELDEYILNESGKIWCGTFKNPTGKHWIFGQFDAISLPTAAFLLEKAGIPPEERGSPISVSRAISAVVNSADDNGLLEGNWDGNYADGVSPHAWTGSTAIMDKYLSAGGKPVKYGQCWVFSAATVSVCRTLGIPCRSVTNYVSAHDTNNTLTVDKYFDKHGDRIEDGPDGDCTDSCWNFHVWNDVWMARPDLPQGYGGWQIIDATPQEQSENMFKCGPASIEAVRRGEVGYLYDTPFVFAEVNADVVHFQEDEESDWGFSKLSINKYHVGRQIITKRPGPTDDEGDSDLWDLTSFYKNKEGSDAERLVIYNAVKGVPRAQQFYNVPSEEEEDVFFDLVDIDFVTFGENFEVVLNVENKSNEDRTISAILSASSVFYTGATANQIKKSKGHFTVKPGKTETAKFIVQPAEYMDKLVDHSLIKIYAIATVEETRQTWSEEDDFTLKKPDMKLDVGYAKVGEECEVKFSFENPLDIPLTQCSYTIEGPGIQIPKTISFRNVEPRELLIVPESFTPKRRGQRKLVVNFTSNEIHGIGGASTVDIQ